MGFDILTPKGRKYAQDQIDAANLVFGRSTARFAHTTTTDKRRHSKIDGAITEHGQLVGFAEIKSREFSLDTLRGEFKNEWLITADKIDFLKSASVIFGVPGYAILYLCNQKIALMIKICDESGAMCADVRYDTTITQATCNGGEAERVNAFIKMDSAKMYR